MNLEFFISKRYFFSLKNNKAINIISGISVLGVMVSTMSMFIVFSVFSGLEKNTETLLNTFNPSIKISAKKGKFFDCEESIIKKIETYENIFSVSKTLEDKVLVKYDKKDMIVYFKGFDEAFLKKEKIKNSIYSGKWFEFTKNTNSVVIGNKIALSLGIPKGETIYPLEIFYPNKYYQKDSTDKIFFSTIFIKKGLFDIEREVNSKYIFSTLKNVQSLFNTEKISSLEIETSSKTTEEQLISLKNKLSTMLGNHFEIQTIKEQNSFFYKMVNTEKIASFGILILIMIISLFNIIGSVVMLILDKKKDIKTLICLGFTNDNIQKIFIFQGLLITFTGCFIGISISSIFVLLQNSYGFIKMSITNSPYPLIFEIKNFFITITTILFLGVISSFTSIKYILKKKIIKNF